jgi:alginate O-acetyltransferase complex protein AlgI
MVFSSITFLAYFLPIFLLLYFIIDKKYKNILLLVGSIIFYAWGAPKFIFVILFTTFIDFHLVKWMDTLQKPLHRKLLLALSVSINLGLLFYFKYCNFFIGNINRGLHMAGVGEIGLLKVIMPIGISFYTFETITYVVDVYRKVHKPLNKFWNYQLYIILFPKLIAGPIVRYHDLADQITERPDKIDDKLHGFYRFVIGLAKKVIIANYMGEQAQYIFNLDYAHLNATGAWMGALCYTFQIYFDFSGYSDMAIGIGRMLGFKFPENFHNPYTATSITDFWRRWHISLGNWMKNYLYIPLGGNRVKKPVFLYINLCIVFLISGFWHGAMWSFIVWGAYHGLFLVLERVFLLKVYKKIGKIPSMLITFCIVMIGWIPFKLESMSKTLQYLKAMLSVRPATSYGWDHEFYFYLCLAIVFSFFTTFSWGQKIQDSIYVKEYGIGKHVLATFTGIALMLVCISFIAANGFNPFIYFRF